MTRSDEREEHIKDLSERTVSLFQELYSCSRADALRHVYNIQFSVDPDMPYRDVQWYASETSESERKGEAK